MIRLDTPNLDDGTSVEDLQRLAHVYSQLSDYCVYRARAKASRFSGDTIAAIEFERRCNTIYNSLPAEARW